MNTLEEFWEALDELDEALYEGEIGVRQYNQYLKDLNEQYGMNTPPLEDFQGLHFIRL